MSARDNNLSLDEVLDFFAMEPNPNPDVLGRYLADYPQFAEELVDLSHEIFRLSLTQERELTSQDNSRISSAWSVLQAGIGKPVPDPLANLSSSTMGELSEALHVPRQVILAFWEKRIAPASVPLRFLERMARVLDASVQSLIHSLSGAQQSLARSHKADDKPVADGDKQDFEQVLREARVPEEEIASLLIQGA
ncbi:hypothetical protein EAH88_18680 [Rhodanobacter glycinis]|uniref:Uncharacterized protein n=1 Tax=Rhodanobacter glycinis TaxID=582702 RepID=A0A502BSD8_9GAMM|nr:hypothetical protein [Rhodanobacter glycinis]TPG04135.1 hypothetical protein EAH88_18680 [Rhodanobacter glycinis]